MSHHWSEMAKTPNLLAPREKNVGEEKGRKIFKRKIKHRTGRGESVLPEQRAGGVRVPENIRRRVKKQSHALQGL